MPTAGRAQVAYDDIGYDGITMKIDGVTITYAVTSVGGSAAVGFAVGWSADETMQLVSDGEAVAGKCVSVFDDGFCTVAFKGFVALPAGTTATVTRGRQVVGALLVAAKGYIRQAVSAGGTYVQAEAVENGRARGRIWSVADTANVWIDLGA